LVVVAALSFALGGVMARSLFDQGLTPFGVAEWRVTAAGLALLSLLAVLRPGSLRLPRRDWLPVAAFGIGSIAALNLLYYAAIARIPVGEANTLQYLAPVLVVAALALRGRRIPPPSLLAALVLTLPGCALVVGLYRPALLRADLLGVGLALAAACFYATYLIAGSVIQRRVPGLTLQVYGFLSAAAGWALLRFSGLAPGWFGTWPAWALPRLLGVAFFASLFPYVFSLLGLRRIGAARTGIVMTTEPVFSTALAFFWLGQGLEAPQLLGGALVLAGVVLAQKTPDRAIVAEPAAMPPEGETLGEPSGQGGSPP
jgi:drug/metabolite transporter (DMT)-like permease